MVHDDFIQPGSTGRLGPDDLPVAFGPDGPADATSPTLETVAAAAGVMATHKPVSREGLPPGAVEDSPELQAEAARRFDLQLEAVQVRRALWRATAAQRLPRAIDLMTGRRFGPWWEHLGYPGVEVDGVFYESEPPPFARQIQRALRVHRLRLMGLVS